MNHVDNVTVFDANAIFASWLGRFAACLELRDAAGAAALFVPDGHWKDLLAFTWEHRLFSGRDHAGSYPPPQTERGGLAPGTCGDPSLAPGCR